MYLALSALPQSSRGWALQTTQSTAEADWWLLPGLYIPLAKLPAELEECLAQQPQLPGVPGSPSCPEDEAADRRLLRLLCTPDFLLPPGQG